MGRIDDLVSQYMSHISAPWQKNLAGAQRNIFIVYDKMDERKLRAKLELFEMATRQANHGWRLHDFTATFARWMASIEYRSTYFEEPDALALRLDGDFVQFAAGDLRGNLLAPD